MQLKASGSGSQARGEHSKGIVSLPASRRSVTVAGGDGEVRHNHRWVVDRTIDRAKEGGGRFSTNERSGEASRPSFAGQGGAGSAPTVDADGWNDGWRSFHNRCIPEVGPGGECQAGCSLTPETPIPHIFQISRSHSRKPGKIWTNFFMVFGQISDRDLLLLKVIKCNVGDNQIWGYLAQYQHNIGYTPQANPHQGE